MVKKSKSKVKQKSAKRKKSIGGRIGWFYLLSFAAIIIVLGSIYINHNFSTLVKNRIGDIYSQTTVSKYYSLDYKKVKVNIITRGLYIYNVSFKPITNSNKKYFDKKGSLNVDMGVIKLSNVNILEFLTINNITVDKVVFGNVEVRINRNGEIFEPFAFIEKKTHNDSLVLDINIDDFELNGASFLLNDLHNDKYNSSFKNLDIALRNLVLKKDKQYFSFLLGKMDVKLNEITHVNTNSLDIKIAELNLETTDFSIVKSKKGIEFSYDKNIIEIVKPQIITKDNVYEISSKLIVYDESSNVLTITDSKVKPLISKKEFVKTNKYQKQLIDIEISEIELLGADIKKLKTWEGVFVKQVNINGGKVKLFKDKHRPLNTRKYPEYLAQQIFNIKKPISVDKLIAKNIDVQVRIKQSDGLNSKIDINKIKLTAINIQNKSKNQNLELRAEGKIENAIPFFINVDFKYKYDYFTYSGEIKKSKLTSIAKSISSFAPIKVHNGIINNVSFNGSASRTYSKGTMRFLYKDLNIEVDIDKPGKSSKISNHLLSIIANTVLNSSNPPTSHLPAREIDYFVERDMNKGFINLILKSLLEGAKESVLPSKENKKKYRKLKHHTKS